MRLISICTPLILSEIVSMFLGEVSNKKNAQFIFSSHAHLIMEDLDKHQIHIVQKDRDGRSEVYRPGFSERGSFC